MAVSGIQGGDAAENLWSMPCASQGLRRVTPGTMHVPPTGLS
jgi:hypothetical protein